MRLPTVSDLLVSLTVLFPGQHRPVAVPRHRRAWPSVELLEDRAVPTVNLGWAFQLGSTAFDNATAAATDAAGDVFVAGAINGSTPVNFDPNPNDAPVTLNPAAGNGFVAKYSSQGTLLWVIQEPRTQDYLQADAAGNCYIAWSGSASGPLYLSKLDPNGTSLWTTNLTQAIPSLYGFKDLAIDGVGNVCLTWGTSGHQAGIAKLAGTDGHLLWQEQLGGYGTRIAVDGQGNIYVAATYSGKWDFDPGPGTYYLSSLTLKKYGSTDDVYVLKLNSSGGFVWAGSLGTDLDDGLGGMTVDISGNVFVTGFFGRIPQVGTTLTKDDFDPGPATYTLPTSNDIFVVKLDTNRNFRWARSFGGPGPDIVNEMAVDTTGSVYVSGYTSSSITFNPGPNQTVITDAGFVFKLDGTGNFNWVAGIVGNTPNTNTVIPSSIAVDPMGNVYDVGRFWSPTNFNPSGSYILTPAGYDPNASTHFPDAFVLKLTQSSPQFAAGGAKTVNPSTDHLTDAQLQPIVAEARSRWLAAGADPVRLATIDIGISDIGGAWLGATYGTSTRIDDNAAGYGWFVDPTPTDDGEFTTPGDQGEQGRMDLLTVVMHEMGLGLGLADGGSGIMQMELPTGTRRLPSADGIANLSTPPAIPTAVCPSLPVNGPAVAGPPAPQAQSRAVSPASADLLFALLSDLPGHRKGPFTTM